MKIASTKFSIAIFLLLIAMLPLCGQTASSPTVVPPPAQRPKVALVLAGGGALGIAHIGVIKMIEELGIPVDIVVGTSMGSIVGGLYSIGYNSADLENIVFGADWVGLFSEGGEFANEPFYDKIDRARYLGELKFDRKGFSSKGGFLSGRKIVNLMDALSLSTPTPLDFDSLPRQFRAVSVDVANGNRIVHKSGSIADAMRASMSIPGVFTPYFLDGKYHIDGGIDDNLPIDIARELGADLVLAVDLVDKSDFDPESVTRTPLTALSRSLDIMLRNNVNPQLPHADLVLTVDTRGYTTADFTRAREICALGEKTASENRDALEKFRDRCVTGGKIPPKPARPPMPVISTVSVEGGTLEDRMRVRTLFEPLVGTAPDSAEIEKLFGELDRDGRYESVRIRLDSASTKPKLIVTIQHKDNQGNFARMDFLFKSTYSKYLSSSLMFAPGYIMRGFPLKDSRITLDTEILDSPGCDATFVQPIMGRFSAGLFYSFHWDFNTWLANSSNYQVRTTSSTSGLRLAVDPATGCEFSLAWSYDRINAEEFAGMVAGTPVNSASLLHADFSVRKTDSPLFPIRGMLGDFRYLDSRHSLGSERSFSTFQTSGGVFIPLGSSFSVSLRWIAGTDFSGKADSTKAAPPYYKPDLSNRILFPGLLSVTERIGSHVAGGGIGIQYDLNAKSISGSVPVFLLASVAGGSVVDDIAEFNITGEKVHWNCATGLGIRINDGFGIEFRGGICRNTEAQYLPFIAFDLGSIGF